MHVGTFRIRSFFRKYLIHFLRRSASGHRPREEYGPLRLHDLQRNVQCKPRRQTLYAVRKLRNRRQLLRVFPVQIIDLLRRFQKLPAFFLNFHPLLRGDQFLSFQSREHGFVFRRISFQNIQRLVHRRCRLFKSLFFSYSIHLVKIFILFKNMVYFKDSHTLEFFKDRFTVFL